MADPARLAEASARIVPKLSQAAAGEQPVEFADTLAIFARSFCDRFNVSHERFLHLFAAAVLPASEPS